MRRKHKPPECVLVEMHVLLNTKWEAFGFVSEFASMNVPYGELAQFNLATGDDGPTDCVQFKVHKMPKRKWWRR